MQCCSLLDHAFLVSMHPELVLCLSIQFFIFCVLRHIQLSTSFDSNTNFMTGTWAWCWHRHFVYWTFLCESWCKFWSWWILVLGSADILILHSFDSGGLLWYITWYPGWNGRGYWTSTGSWCSCPCYEIQISRGVNWPSICKHINACCSGGKDPIC